MITYTFTRDQLQRLLEAVIDLHVEYRDVHSYEEADAQFCAIAETLDALDAERELADAGEYKATMQTLED